MAKVKPLVLNTLLDKLMHASQAKDGERNMGYDSSQAEAECVRVPRPPRVTTFLWKRARSAQGATYLTIIHASLCAHPVLISNAGSAVRIIDRAYLRHCKARERRENVVRVKHILGILTSLRLIVVKNDTRTFFYSFIYLFLQKLLWLNEQ